LAYENKLAMHVSDHEAMGSPDHVTLQEKACVFAVVAVAEGMEPGQLGLTGYMRQDLQAALNDKFTVITYNADQTRDGLYSVNITVDLAKATDRAPADIDGAKFSEELSTRLMGRMFNDGQALLYDMYGCNMRLVVSTLEVPNLAGLAAVSHCSCDCSGPSPLPRAAPLPPLASSATVPPSSFLTRSLRRIITDGRHGGEPRCHKGCNQGPHLCQDSDHAEEGVRLDDQNEECRICGQVANEEGLQSG
jgi:hypothetical protein